MVSISLASRQTNANCEAPQDMTNLLRLRFEDDNDGTGELFAEVHQGLFSGLASAWFAVEEVRAFGQALQDRSPLESGSPIKLEGGFWANAGPTRIEHLHLGLAVYPIGSTGVVGIGVTLATQIHQFERPESRCSVTVELQTNYEPLRVFGRSVVALVTSKAEPATLLANDT